MSVQREERRDERMERAIAELQARIQAQYPTTSFVLSGGDDPVGTYLTAVVDVDDTDAVVDLVIDRLLALQVDEGLPLYVLPVRPPERLSHAPARVP